MMMLAFQIVLILLMLFSFMGLVSEVLSKNKVHYTSIVLASIVAMCVTFLIK